MLVKVYSVMSDTTGLNTGRSLSSRKRHQTTFGNKTIGMAFILWIVCFMPTKYISLGSLLKLEGEKKGRGAMLERALVKYFFNSRNTCKKQNGFQVEKKHEPKTDVEHTLMMMRLHTLSSHHYVANVPKITITNAYYLLANFRCLPFGYGHWSNLVRLSFCIIHMCGRLYLM